MPHCGYYQANISSKISFLTKILKTMKNFIFSFFAITTLIFASCQKDVSISETISAGNVKTDGAKNVDSTINVNINVPESAGIVYVYNGVETDAKNIDFSNDNLVDAFGFIANDSRHYIFDNDAQLGNWASSLSNTGAKEYLLSAIDDVNAVKAIATSTNALAVFGSTGAAPVSYNVQVNDYWQNKYGTRPMKESLGALYDECGPKKVLFPMIPGPPVPYFPNNARNKVSYIEGLGLTVDVFATRPFLFGRKFYFFPIYYVFGKSLCGHWFNNNNESCLSGF
jgi:hypothetical protein